MRAWRNTGNWEEKSMMLYHYCDNKKMANIIAGHTLRMSDITKSNDYEEIQLFYPYIMTAIEKEYKMNPFSLDYKGEKDFEALKRLLHVTHKLVNIEFDVGEMTSFVVCFCEEGDVLSQWRGYADSGKGGAIGFSLEELKEYCKLYDGIITLAKVKYISREELQSVIADKAKEVLLNLQNDIGWIADKFSMFDDGEEYNILLQTRMLHIIKKVLISSLEYKHESFSEEKEWRIFFSEEITKNPQWLFADEEDSIMKYHHVIPKLKNKIEFNITDNDMIPYYPIDLYDISSEPIKEIILGPKNNILERDFELYAAKYNMKNIVLRLSEISFRG